MVFARSGGACLVEVLLGHFHDLVTDNFGNYVLQHVLEYGTPYVAQIMKFTSGMLWLRA